MSWSRDHKVAMSKLVLSFIFTMMLPSASLSAPVHDQQGIMCSKGTSIQHRNEIVNAPHFIGDICDVQGSNIKGRWMWIATGEVDCRYCCGGFHWDEEYQNCVKCPEGSTSKAGPFTQCTHIDPTESINTQSPPVGSTQSPLPVNSSPTHIHATDSSTPSYEFQTSAEIRHSERPITRSGDAGPSPGNNMGEVIWPILALGVIIFLIIILYHIKCILTYLHNIRKKVASSCQSDTASSQSETPSSPLPESERLNSPVSEEATNDGE